MSDTSTDTPRAPVSPVTSAAAGATLGMSPTGRREPATAARASFAVSPVGDATPQTATDDRSDTATLARDPNLVTTRDGQELRFSDLRAYVQPIDANQRPLDIIRERLGGPPSRALPTPQEIWSSYEEREPSAARAAADGVTQIQVHIDSGHYSEETPALVTETRFIETAAYYLEKDAHQAPSHAEVLDDLRSHYRGWAKSEAAWSAYEDHIGIHAHQERGAQPAQAQAETPALGQAHDLSPSR
jgi:hypothetical protein